MCGVPQVGQVKVGRHLGMGWGPLRNWGRYMQASLEDAWNEAGGGLGRVFRLGRGSGGGGGGGRQQDSDVVEHVIPWICFGVSLREEIGM